MRKETLIGRPKKKDPKVQVGIYVRESALELKGKEELKEVLRQAAEKFHKGCTN